MQLNITDTAGAASGKTIDLSDDTFAVDYKESLIHQVVNAYMAAGRSGTHSQKTRSEVRGGGKKPWRQKGTGRARAGTIRSPIWRGGGRAFAASTRDYSQKVNKKMYRGAMKSILSELIRQERLVVVSELELAEPKTKLLLSQLKALDLGNALIVTDVLTENLALAARNLYEVDVCDAASVDPVSLVKFDKVLVTVAGLKLLEERLG